MLISLTPAQQKLVVAIVQCHENRMEDFMSQLPADINAKITKELGDEIDRTVELRAALTSAVQQKEAPAG